LLSEVSSGFSQAVTRPDLSMERRGKMKTPVRHAEGRTGDGK
jgi:hypothetical protein